MSEITTAVELFGDRILLCPIEQENESPAGLILIPDTVQKQPTQRGEVIAVGPGVQFDLHAGDIVLHSKYGGSQLQLAGVTYLLLSSRDIHARLHDEQG